MNVLNQGSKIPSVFKIANQEIKVVIEESLPENDYGNFCDVTNTIKLTRSINTKDGLIRLSDQQMLNTFYHELIHCFQFYYNNVYDEIQAQVFANFICEYIESTNKPF